MDRDQPPEPVGRGRHRGGDGVLGVGVGPGDQPAQQHGRTAAGRDGRVGAPPAGLPVAHRGEDERAPRAGCPCRYRRQRIAPRPRSPAASGPSVVRTSCGRRPWWASCPGHWPSVVRVIAVVNTRTWPRSAPVSGAGPGPGLPGGGAVEGGDCRRRRCRRRTPPASSPGTVRPTPCPPPAWPGSAPRSTRRRRRRRRRRCRRRRPPTSSRGRRRGGHADHRPVEGGCRRWIRRRLASPKVKTPPSEATTQ